MSGGCDREKDDGPSAWAVEVRLRRELDAVSKERDVAQAQHRAAVLLLDETTGLLRDERKRCDAWVSAAFKIACDAPHLLAERILRLVKERDVARDERDALTRRVRLFDDHYIQRANDAIAENPHIKRERDDARAEAATLAERVRELAAELRVVTAKRTTDEAEAMALASETVAMFDHTTRAHRLASFALVMMRERDEVRAKYDALLARLEPLRDAVQLYRALDYTVFSESRDDVVKVAVRLFSEES